jgi:uncharacterized SAM-binding protein YcdF (DUF218 family)
MTFLLKKIISQFLMPETFCIFIILVGLIFLWCKRKQKIGKILVTLGTLLLLLFSYSFIANYISATLEKQYPSLPQNADPKLQNIKYVVVLGGGVKVDKSQPVSSQIGETTLVRLVEGIRLLHLYPNTKLILSGGKTFNSESEAAVMKSVAIILGVSDSKIIEDNISLDTQMQANNLKNIIHENKFFLVTSAVHMPRSMILFRNEGMNPIPAPTAYYSRELRNSPFLYFPSPSSITQCSAVFHEYLGLIWYKINNI